MLAVKAPNTIKMYTTMYQKIKMKNESELAELFKTIAPTYASLYLKALHHFGKDYPKLYEEYKTLSKGYVKKQVTAVIDYSPVTTFCPEVNQVLVGNGQGGGWLSGPELENRMCIAGLQGSVLHVTAWVVDGIFAGVQSQAHEVDPSDVLYSDGWSHT